MAADWTIVSGDTEPDFVDQLTYSNGEVANLSGASVVFTMRAFTSEKPVTLTGTTTVTAATEGKVKYAPAAADTSGGSGWRAANWHGTFASGQTETFPTQGYLLVRIDQPLGASPALLIELGEVKEKLYIPASDRTHDAVLLNEIEAVGPLIEEHTGPILPATHDEWYEGGSSSISLRHRPSFGYGTSPVLNILACSEYRGPIEYNISLISTPTQGSVYSAMLNAELGTLVRRTSGGGTYAWWSDPSHPQQSVHIVYEAGQETVPANVRRAAAETIRWWWETTMMVGKGSLAQADAETYKPLVALPNSAVAMHAPTRRHPSFA